MAGWGGGWGVGCSREVSEVPHPCTCSHRYPTRHSSNSRIVGGSGPYDGIKSASPASMTPARLLL